MSDTQIMSSPSTPSIPSGEAYEASPFPEGLDALGWIRELACRGVSGELVFASGSDQAVVYFQAGRVAWANDSLHRRAFIEHLRQAAGIEQRDVEEVVEECRQTGRPIGESLVAWRLATLEQVRAALRNQIALALLVATRCGGTPRFEPHEYRGKHDVRFTFDADELLTEPAAHAPCAVVPLHGTAQGRSGEGPTARAGGRPEHDAATVAQKLGELQDVDGFRGAALLTPSGERIALLGGDAPRLEELGILANALLASAKKASLEMGAGRGRQVHVEGEHAQVLARCLDDGDDSVKSLPGKAHVHLVLVLKHDAPIGLAKLRMDAVLQRLAVGLRG